MSEPLAPEAIIQEVLDNTSAWEPAGPAILAALERAGYVVTLAERPDYWPHRGAVNGLHLADPGGINVGRDGRPLPAEPDPWVIAPLGTLRGDPEPAARCECRHYCHPTVCAAALPVGVRRCAECIADGCEA